ncbi:hypothetical protein GCM10020358_37620 [Amorphoplanes nipponensis]|uniref:hypothetical protein n=1 Tax=Actinoplanes nipponensis TaxID=135950 RepID=UPI0031EF84C5
MTVRPIGMSRLLAVAPVTEAPVAPSCRTDMADMPTKCMPLTAMPMTRADARMASGRCTVMASHSATVAATTAMMTAATTRLVR